MTGEYAGDLSPDEAMKILKSDPDATLVDVRTTAEWTFVGVPDLSSLGKETLLVEWQSYPSMAPNRDFAATLKTKLATVAGSQDAPVLFLCRSGARSSAAAKAMTAQGFARCFNVEGGFEGAPDPSRHRGLLEGWKAAGLPWSQS